MINRELIRIKIVQLTYAYYQNGNKLMDSAEKELLFSLSKAYDLYNYLLELIVAVTQEERNRVEVATKKAAREGQPMPSQKFAYNKFAVQLEENKMLQEFAETQKQSWANSVEFVRGLCNQIEQSQAYAEYMADTDDSYEADRESGARFIASSFRRTRHWTSSSRSRASTGTTTRKWWTHLCSRPSSASTRRTRPSRNSCRNIRTLRTRTSPLSSSDQPSSTLTSISAI